MNKTLCVTAILLLLCIVITSAALAGEQEIAIPVNGYIGESPGPFPPPIETARPWPPGPIVTKNPVVNPDDIHPKTGDDESMLPYALTALLAAILLVLLWWKRPDNAREEF